MRQAGALIALLALPAGAAPHAEFVGSYVWEESSPGFGGFSGFELEPDGVGFIAISDRGALWRGTLSRDDSGAVSGVSGTETLLRKPPVKEYDFDSEGLALAPDGRLFVSFEGRVRVEELGKGKLPKNPPFQKMPDNAALEALAIAPDESLITMPEQEKSGGDFPVYRFASGTWSQPFSLPRDGPFLPTGADFGPDGRLYILERVFTGFAFRSRVRSFAYAGDALTDPVTLFETGAGRHDNLEGLALWQDATGATRLTLISDDNFRFWQRTELVDYIVKD